MIAVLIVAILVAAYYANKYHKLRRKLQYEAPSLANWLLHSDL